MFDLSQAFNRFHESRIVALALVMVLYGPSLWAQEARALAKPGEAIERMVRDVDAVSRLLQGRWVKKWVAEVGHLQPIEPKKIVVGEKETDVDESYYYMGRYGSPLAYARLLDLAESNGFREPKGAKVFDFGYGSIGHLQMLARCGAHTTAVDVDPLLPEIYKDASGAFGSGSVQLLHGRFPFETTLVEEAGTGYDLVISKNTLKRGYIHPSRTPTSPRHVIDLGVDDEDFLAAIAKLLKPQGLFVIYNFCPAKAAEDKPYIPWAEGESPFTRDQFATAGFEVLEFDQVDDQAARELAKALRWDSEGGMKLDSELFAWYTVVRRR